MPYYSIISKVLEKWLETVCFKSVILEKTELKELVLPLLLHAGCLLLISTSWKSWASLFYRNENEHFDYFSMYKSLNFINKFNFFDSTKQSNNQTYAFWFHLVWFCSFSCLFCNCVIYLSDLFFPLFILLLLCIL